MQNFDSFDAEMRAQAVATLRAGEPELARAVLDQIIAKTIKHPDFAPLQALTARIGAGVIAESFGARKLEQASSAWQAIRNTLGEQPAHAAREHAGQCAYNMLMGQIATGQGKEMQATYACLARWAAPAAPSVKMQTLLAEAGLRIIMVRLQLHPVAEVYELYVPLRTASEHHPCELPISQCRAKAALLLIAAFAHTGNPDFARSLAAEVRALIATAPQDPTMADIQIRLDRLYSSSPSLQA